MNRELLAYKINFKFYSFLAFLQTFNDVKTTLVSQLTQSFHANEVIFVNFKFPMTDNNLYPHSDFRRYLHQINILNANNFRVCKIKSIFHFYCGLKKEQI